jgi:hypothetical protein
MLKLIIITNNPLAETKYPSLAEFLGSGTGGVLSRARDYIHTGAKLINHPLSGGVLPGVNPYKSLIVTAAAKSTAPGTDIMSLSLIENAIGSLKKAPDGFEGYDEKTLEDFMATDLDMLDSAMKSLQYIT